MSIGLTYGVSHVQRCNVKPEAWLVLSAAKGERGQFRTSENRSVCPGALRTPAVKASSLRRQSLPLTREDKAIIRRELGCKQTGVRKVRQGTKWVK